MSLKDRHHCTPCETICLEGNSIIHLGLHYDGFCDCHNLHGMTPGYRHLKVPQFDIKCEWHDGRITMKFESVLPILCFLWIIAVPAVHCIHEATIILKSQNLTWKATRRAARQTAVKFESLLPSDTTDNPAKFRQDPLRRSGVIKRRKKKKKKKTLTKPKRHFSQNA